MSINNTQSTNSFILGTAFSENPDLSEPKFAMIPESSEILPPGITEIRQRTFTTGLMDEGAFENFFDNLEHFPRSPQENPGFGTNLDTSHLLLEDLDPRVFDLPVNSSSQSAAPEFELPVTSSSQPHVIVVSSSSSGRSFDLPVSSSSQSAAPEFDLPVTSSSQPHVIVVSSSSSGRSDEDLKQKRGMQKQQTRARKRQRVCDLDQISQQNVDLKRELNEAKKREKQLNYVIADLQKQTTADMNTKTYVTLAEHRRQMDAIKEQYEQKMDEMRQQCANLSAKCHQLTRELSYLRSSSK